MLLRCRLLLASVASALVIISNFANTDNPSVTYYFSNHDKSLIHYEILGYGGFSIHGGLLFTIDYSSVIEVFK